MARIYEIESDSAFNNAPVVESKALVYLAYDQQRLVQRARLNDGSVVTMGPDVDLSNYYTKLQTDQLLEALSDSLHSAILNIQQNFSNYATLQHLSDSYYDKAEVEALISSQDLSNYYTKIQTDALIGALSDSLHGNYYTKAQVDQIAISGQVDLSNYYTKLQTQSLINSLSDSFHDAVDSIIATLSDSYYTKIQTDAIISSLSDSFHGWFYTLKQNLSDSYYTKYQVDLLIQPYDDSQLKSRLDQLSDSLHEAYYTKFEINSFIGALSDSLDTKMRLPSNQGSPGQVLTRTSQGWQWSDAQGSSQAPSDCYTKAQVDALITDLSDSMHAAIGSIRGTLSSDYYTKAQVNQIALSGEVDLDDYYTKIQVDALISSISDSLHQNYYTITQTNTLLEDYVQQSALSNSYYTKDQVVAIIQEALAAWDAPSDGKAYVRQNGQWIQFSGVPQEQVEELYERIKQIIGQSSSSTISSSDVSSSSWTPSGKIITVSGAGTSICNGIYTQTGLTSDNYPVYSNGTTYLLKSNTWLIGDSSDPSAIENLYYTSAGGPQLQDITAWAAVLGQTPIPTLTISGGITGPYVNVTDMSGTSSGWNGKYFPYDVSSNPAVYKQSDALHYALLYTSGSGILSTTPDTDGLQFYLQTSGQVVASDLSTVIGNWTFTQGS